MSSTQKVSHTLRVSLIAQEAHVYMYLSRRTRPTRRFLCCRWLQRNLTAFRLDYTTTYVDSLDDARSSDGQWTSSEPPDTHHSIPTAMLPRPDTILFYAEIPLFDDELHDKAHLVLSFVRNVHLPIIRVGAAARRVQHTWLVQGSAVRARQAVAVAVCPT